MSLGDTFENDLLKLIFNAVAIANIADNAASSPATNYYISLHTADIGEGGNQTTNEATYTGYARMAVLRTTGGWTVSTNTATNFADIVFATCTGGTNTITHVGVGTASSGTGKVLVKGALAASFQGPFTAATSDTFTAPGHTFANTDRVAFYPLPGSSLPTGVTEGTLYYIISASGDTFQISLTSGGAAVDITASGDGVAFKCTTLAVSNTIAPTFAAGAMVFTAD